MSIFKRRDHADVEHMKAEVPEANVQEAQSDQLTAHEDAARPPGVVPPPATPIYSTRQPAPHADAETVVSEPSRVARDAQEQVQEPVSRTAPIAARKRVTAAPTPSAPSASRSRQRVASPSVGAYTPPARRAAAPPRMAFIQPRHTFDAVGAAQAGLLNLAWRWAEAGAPIRAINAYYDVLIRYPGSPGADAAVADLVDLSDRLAHTGQFHIALAIYDHLEELLD
jgi:hypothetical protein